MNRYEQYVAFMTIMRKEIRRYLRIWSQTLLPSAITMSLYYGKLSWQQSQALLQVSQCKFSSKSKISSQIFIQFSIFCKCLVRS